MREQLDEHLPGTALVAVPDCGHHVMADQPIAFVAALRATLGEWVRQGMAEANHPKRGFGRMMPPPLDTILPSKL